MITDQAPPPAALPIVPVSGASSSNEVSPANNQVAAGAACADDGQNLLAVRVESGALLVAKRGDDIQVEQSECFGSFSVADLELVPDLQKSRGKSWLLLHTRFPEAVSMSDVRTLLDSTGVMRCRPLAYLAATHERNMYVVLNFSKTDVSRTKKFNPQPQVDMCLYSLGHTHRNAKELGELLNRLKLCSSTLTGTMHVSVESGSDSFPVHPKVLN